MVHVHFEFIILHSKADVFLLRDCQDTSDESSIEDWANTLRPAAAADTSALLVTTHAGVSQQTLPIGFDGDDRVYWNEPDGIIIRKSEYGGILPKDWELNKDRLQGRFFFPVGNSLVS